MTLDARLFRRGFTLVELLVAMLIITILAAAILGVAAVAGETAREARTKNMIARIHTLLMEHQETYKSRRIKLRETVGTVKGIRQLIEEGIPTTVPNSGARRGAARAEARLYALRELMVMEMPDRWSDVLLGPVPTAPTGRGDARAPLYLETRSSSGSTQLNRTPLAQIYLRHYDRLVRAGVTRDQILENQSAELLYLIVMNACGDGEARTLFPASNIGDTDGDGALEFLDGWGNPISFLRWAPGFSSDVQENANLLDNPPSGTTVDQAWTAAASLDHDPYDLFRAEPRAFRLVPLIVSAGRDEDLGIDADEARLTWWNSSAFTVSSTGPPFFTSPRLSPYLLVSPSNTYLGSDDGSKTATDNIHNHLIGTR